MVQFGAIIFCRTFKNYFGQFVWIEKKATIIVAFHFMKRRLKVIKHEIICSVLCKEMPAVRTASPRPVVKPSRKLSLQACRSPDSTHQRNRIIDQNIGKAYPSTSFQPGNSSNRRIRISKHVFFKNTLFGFFSSVLVLHCKHSSLVLPLTSVTSLNCFQILFFTWGIFG